MAKPPPPKPDGYEGADTTARVVLRELTQASDRRNDHHTFDRILEANHGSLSEPCGAPSSRAMPTLPRITLPLALQRPAHAGKSAHRSVGFGSFVALSVAILLLAGSLALLGHVLAGDGEVESAAASLAPHAPLTVVQRAPATMATPVPARTAAPSMAIASPAPVHPRRTFAAAPTPSPVAPAPPPRALSTPSTTTLVEEY